MRKQLSAAIILFVSLLVISTSVHAVTLPSIFSNHMVLQQNAEVTIWGWGKTGEEITVTSSWDNKAIKTKADNQAKWQVKVQTSKAGGPYTLKVQGYNTINIEDILLGEVWLCSGQSNMEWTPGAKIDNGEEEAAKANFSSIRFFSVSYRTADAPQADLVGQWVVCTPQTMMNFSAVGYFFGREIHQNLNAPVGLINSSWGGTPIEIWMNPSAFMGDKELADHATNRKDVEWGPVKPGKAYHAMIAPLIPFRLAGALWYQGEGNTDNPEDYAKLLPALIKNWRTEWKNEFPFYFVQLAPYNYGSDAGVRLRESQRLSLRVPNTGMAIISDIGNPENIHPTNKIDVGKRLALLALNKTYGKKDVVPSGPLYRDMKVEGNKIRLTFDYADKGLVSKTKEVQGFEIAGADQKFVKAEAKISGNSVVLQAKGVKNPVAARLNWSSTAEATLFNKYGLPASSFSTTSSVKE